MHKEHRESFYLAFQEFYSGNQDAIALSFMLLEVAHVWDDLIDEDEVSKENIDKVFKYLIYDIPMNPIYKMIPGINSHLLNIFLRWRDATAMESKENPDLEKTYMLRAGIYDIFSIITYYLLGDEKAKEMGPKIRALYGETLEGLKEEFNHA